MGALMGGKGQMMQSLSLSPEATAEMQANLKKRQADFFAKQGPNAETNPRFMSQENRNAYAAIGTNTLAEAINKSFGDQYAKNPYPATPSVVNPAPAAPVAAAAAPIVTPTNAQTITAGETGTYGLTATKKSAAPKGRVSTILDQLGSFSETLGG